MAAGSSTPVPARLREVLAALSQVFGSSDIAASDSAIATVSDLLDAAAAAAAAALDDDEAVRFDRASVAEQLLRELHVFLTCPSSNQMAVDALSLVLPKAVAKLGALSENCRALAAAIIVFFVSSCSPRDMLSILCEALDTQMASLRELVYFVVLLDGLAKVLILIQRRQVEQVKAALPIVLRVLYAITSENVEEHETTTIDLCKAAIRIGNAIQEVCKTVVNQKKEEICAILVLYALQNIALISRSKQQNILSVCGSLILHLSEFLSFCGVSYLGLLTGNDVTSATYKLSNGVPTADADEGDELLGCFSLAMDGAILAVVWACMCDDIPKSVREELESALKEVQNNHIEKWQALGMFKYVLASIDYPWVIKSQTIELLLTIVGGNHGEESNDDIDFSSYAPSVFVMLQGIERVMMAATDASLRKKAFSALRKVISLVPSSQRFDVLEALIKNSMSPSLTAILLDLVKEEVLTESCQANKNIIESGCSQNDGPLQPWISHALELVQLILRPPEGGPPCLPDHGEQVLSALNLLRFILIMDDSKGSRTSKIFPEKTLRKVYFDWLIPLRLILAGTQAESEKNDSEVANQIMCVLNPVQLVLYRCIELVEKKMKSS